MVSELNIFVGKWSKIAAQKKDCFSANFFLLPGFSKHRPSGPMLSISRFVHMSVCFCLSVHFLRYRLNVFLPPFPEVGCPIFLEIRNLWGKVMEINGLRFEHFSLEGV